MPEFTQRVAEFTTETVRRAFRPSLHTIDDFILMDQTIPIFLVGSEEGERRV